MSNLSAEKYYKEGLIAFKARAYKQAAPLFRQALDLDRDRGRIRPEMRYLSYYGLSLARAGLSQKQAIEACRTAVKQQGNDPLLYLNLARVYVLNCKLAEAMEMYERGLRLSPDDPTLRRELNNLDRRTRAVLPFLPRSNALNVGLGKLRSRMLGGLNARPVRG
jgi:tetratricopeptide (TPR) repeat protein